MNDMISRQAAIAHAVPLNLFGREVMMVSVSELENLPSAQADVPDTNVGDLISRQAAITAIQKAYADTEGGTDKCAVWKNVGLTNALHIMQDLPSAQPETHDKRTETHACDYIERQAAKRMTGRNDGLKVGLIDVDGHNYPNLPLMKISAWHKQQGDSVEWYSPMFSGHLDRVYMSKVFSFTQDFQYFVDADEIFRGGSGYCIELVDGKEVYHAERDTPLPYEVEHIYPDYSLYPELTGYGKPLSQQVSFGFLTRGCPRGCGFCHVKAKEGLKSHKVADLSEFWRGQGKIILSDPNILACKEHTELLQQLIDSKAKVNFNQGIDIRLVTDKNMELLKQIRLESIHFAFDRYQDKDIIEPRLRAFAEKTGYNKSKGRVMVYILCNYDTTLAQDIYRIQLCRELRFSPYPMVYDKEHADPIYRKLQRWCNNFIFWKVPTFEEYNRR